MANLGTLNQIMDDFLARDDLTSNQSQIALLATSQLILDVYPMAEELSTEITNVDLGGGVYETFFRLPTGFILPKAVSMVDPDTYELIQVSTRQLMVAKNQIEESGSPAWFSLIGDTIELWPPISSTAESTISLVYMGTITTPSDPTDENSVMAAAPHLWHHLAMVYAYELTKDLEMRAVHMQSYEQAKRAFNTQQQIRRFGGAPIQVRTNRRRVV